MNETIAATRANLLSSIQTLTQSQFLKPAYAVS